ncbi:AMP-binding protein [Bacillus sp. 37MA]|uniref:AMP-binding protein n=1 Tax=Bacillus sp. 37MA TaxID=1132442 RepID=UPI0003820A93|nr:AMP-binding protein [Bacillus sp. 37MA]
MMNITSTYPLRAQTCPEPFFVKTKEQTFTYKEWEDMTKRAAGWLLSVGHPGETIALTALNRWEVLVIFCGAARAGWTFMPLDPRMTKAEREERLRLAAPKLFIGKDSLAKIGQLIMNTEPTDFCSDDEEAIFYSGFTSGSSGVPKQFGRSHRSWIKSFEAGLTDFLLTGEETAIIAGPIHHSLFLYGAAFALYTGQRLILHEKFWPHHITQTLKETPSFVMYAVPTMLESLMKTNDIEGKGFVFLSGAGWTAERKQQWVTQYPNAALYEFYGASELSFVSYMTPKDYNHKPSSSGKLSTGVEIEIRHGSQVLPAGETGTVYVKSSMLFSGYAKDDSYEMNIEEDGFYTVGDAGYMDEDGYLHIIGREQFMMISGGVNVYPEEVERVILKYAGVKEAAVTSIHDIHLGERIVCLYTGRIDPIRLKAYTKAYLSIEKMPRKWARVDSLPHTTNGKIARNELKKMALEVFM